MIDFMPTGKLREGEGRGSYLSSSPHRSLSGWLRERRRNVFQLTAGTPRFCLHDDRQARRSSLQILPGHCACSMAKGARSQPS
jgi:hypothetical protein